ALAESAADVVGAVGQLLTQRRYGPAHAARPGAAASIALCRHVNAADCAASRQVSSAGLPGGLLPAHACAAASSCATQVRIAALSVSCVGSVHVSRASKQPSVQLRSLSMQALALTR